MVAIHKIAIDDWDKYRMRNTADPDRDDETIWGGFVSGQFIDRSNGGTNPSDE